MTVETNHSDISRTCRWTSATWSPRFRLRLNAALRFPSPQEQDAASRSAVKQQQLSRPAARCRHGRNHPAAAHVPLEHGGHLSGRFCVPLPANTRWDHNVTCARASSHNFTFSLLAGDSVPLALCYGEEPSVSFCGLQPGTLHCSRLHLRASSPPWKPPSWWERCSRSRVTCCTVVTPTSTHLKSWATQEKLLWEDVAHAHVLKETLCTMCQHIFSTALFSSPLYLFISCKQAAVRSKILWDEWRGDLRIYTMKLKEKTAHDLLIQSFFNPKTV